MNCIKCKNCIPYYKKYFPSNWKKWYLGFFFKACHIEPEEFFWGNPYAPIWFVGRNPASPRGIPPTEIILDERWELLLKNYAHFLSKRATHFTKYDTIINRLLPTRKQQFCYIGFCDAVKCYSESFAPHPGSNKPNLCNKNIYETCIKSYLIKNYQEYKPYVIVFRGSLDEKMYINSDISYKKEVINSFKSIGITLSFNDCSSSDLQYAVNYDKKLLIILTMFKIEKYSYYDNIIPQIIKNFFWELKQKSFNTDLCNNNSQAEGNWNTIINKLDSCDLSNYTINTTGVGKMDLNDVNDVYQGKTINCSKYCKDPTPDAKVKESQILDIYRKCRDSFDKAIKL
jgi:hypothetical protein